MKAAKERSEGAVKVSFIVAAREGEEHLARCLKSILAQAPQEIEVLCAAEGRTAAVGDARVREVPCDMPWSGLAETARGDYLCRVLPEDTLLPHACEALFSKAARYNADCLRFCAVAWDAARRQAVRDADCELSALREGDFHRLFALPGDSALARLTAQPWLWLLRRDFLRARLAGEEALRPGEDGMLLERLLAGEARAVACRDRLVLHRVASQAPAANPFHAPCPKPHVSVVVPVYNQEEYLNQALHSLTEQTLEEMEFICVNDGSTDGSMAILREYAALDGRVRIIDKPNSGYGHTMNVGIDAAKGEYLGILEPDDFVPPDMYGRLYEIACAQDADMVKADFYRFRISEGGETEKTLQRLTWESRYYGRLIHPGEEMKTMDLVMNTWSGIYRLAFLNRWHIRHNETPGASYQDNGFWFQTFCRAERAWFVNAPFYMNRRDNPNSSVFSRGKMYAVTEEYRFIYEYLAREPALLAKYEGVFYAKKFNNFAMTYDRLARENRRGYLQHMREEFLPPMREGRLQKEWFSRRAWRALRAVLKDPDAYYEKHAEDKKLVEGDAVIRSGREALIRRHMSEKSFTGPLAGIRRRGYMAWCMLRYGGAKTLLRAVAERFWS